MEFHLAYRRLAGRFVFRQTPGPTYFARQKVVEGSPLSAFSVFTNESTVCFVPFEQIQKLRQEEHCQMRPGPVLWGELDTFLGLAIARDFLGARNLPLKSQWSKEWGVQLFPNAMTRDRFLEILRFLRFDKKEERSERLSN